ncbi:SAM-dependent methyltransferase [Actinocorallia populi]|uniref:SAM-dependent methyltransferase n=1 Tax=Actinocorallia populi TaxID=2079200 RepID=UPI0018E50A74|nr:SAM-dependent methyltransferase [Actinocorallia populi]
MSGKSVIPDIDTTTAHSARMYDYYLGGKDNYAVDRKAADGVIALFPDTPRIAAENRAFMRRATAAMVREGGVRQFVDLGSGLPTVDNLHEVAQRTAPGSRVVYVDNDPIVLAHGRALLEGNGLTRVITADLRDPDGLLADSALTGLIDFDRPVGLMMISVLHFIEGDLAPLLAGYLDRLAPGSYLALSHVNAENADTGRADLVRNTYRNSASSLTYRTRDEIAGLLAGCDLLDPGIVPAWRWRPDSAGTAEPAPAAGDVRPARSAILAGVGRLAGR